MSRDKADIKAGKLAALGDLHFLNALNFFNRAGVDVKRSPTDAFQQCEERALAGDVEAQYVLAALLISGALGPRNEADALRHCEMAVRQEFPPAMLLLAGFHESGWAGLRVSLQVGRELMERAVARGYVPAMRVLGFALLGEAADNAKSRGSSLLRQASQLGDSVARTYLAESTLKNSVDPNEIASALGALRSAASAGEPLANRLLGYINMTGAHGVLANRQIAESYFRKAEAIEQSRWGPSSDS